MSQWDIKFDNVRDLSLNIRFNEKTYLWARTQGLAVSIGIDFEKNSCLARDIRLIETYNWLKELDRVAVCRPPPVYFGWLVPIDCETLGAVKLCKRAPPWNSGFHFFGYTARWGNIINKKGRDASLFFFCALIWVDKSRFWWYNYGMNFKLILLKGNLI